MSTSITIQFLFIITRVLKTENILFVIMPTDNFNAKFPKFIKRCMKKNKEKKIPRKCLKSLQFPNDEKR